MIEVEVDSKTAHAATGGKPFDATLPLVVFVHGANMDHTVWALQSRYFAYNGYGVLALDLPGHGRSEGPGLDSIPAMGAWIWQLVDAVGGGEAALVGHSMGALVTLEAARQGPDRTRALALVGASAPMPVSEGLLTATREAPSRARRMIISYAYGQRSHIGGMRVPGLWMSGGGLSLLDRGDDTVLAQDFTACNAYDEGTAAAAAVTCPSLILCGDDDRMTPARAGRALAEHIPDSRVTIIPDCGHMLPAEQPDRVLDALAAFL
ncbi:MAG: alpha/beta hydrolase [Alphaproteobacteria bacterium]|nr:alpha/beta hydrolase [Alphaproteobacteria bacterium]